jgi:hypothetical protein
MLLKSYWKKVWLMPKTAITNYLLTALSGRTLAFCAVV